MKNINLRIANILTMADKKNLKKEPIDGHWDSYNDSTYHDNYHDNYDDYGDSLYHDEYRDGFVSENKIAIKVNVKKK